MYRMPSWIFPFVEEFWIQVSPNSQDSTLPINTIQFWGRVPSFYHINVFLNVIKYSLWQGVLCLSSSWPQGCRVSPFSYVYGCSLTALCIPILLRGCAQQSYSTLLYMLSDHLRKDTGWRVYLMFTMVTFPQSSVLSHTTRTGRHGLC